MKNYRFTSRLALSALAALAFASCEKAQESVTSPGIETAVRMRFQSGNVGSMTTKSVTETTVSSLLQGGFKVAAVRSDATPVFNCKAVYDGSYFEAENGPYYYPKTGTVDFYAVYPPEEVITLGSDGEPTLSYTENPEEDLTVASALGIRRQASAVQLNFKHILTQADIKCAGADPHVTYKVSSVSVKAPTSGTWNWADWTPSDEKSVYEYLQSTATLSGTTAMGEAKSFIPGTWKLTVSYTCHDKDDVIVGSYTKSTKVTLEQGKICTVTATLPNDDSETIRFTITAEAWAADSFTTDFSPAATYGASEAESLTLPGFTLTDGTCGSVEWGDGESEDFTSAGLEETKSSFSDGTLTLSHSYEDAFSGSVKIFVDKGSIDFGEVTYGEGSKFSILKSDRVSLTYSEPDGLKFSASSAQTLSMTHNGGNNPTLEYTYDGVWHSWDGSALSFGGDGAGSVFVRGANKSLSTSANAYSTFVLSDDNVPTACTGNAMKLLGESATKLGDVYCFYRLFYGCKALTSMPELPATELKTCCYESMFEGCTSLTATTALPATYGERRAYRYMFKGCTSLSSAGAISLTSVDEMCCMEIFSGCTSLATAPDISNAEPAGSECFREAFKDCTSLVHAPDLNSTIVTESCYSSMFKGCTALTDGPASIPASTMQSGSCMMMFHGCTSLTSAPALPATTLAANCYNAMFYGCSSLQTAPELPATTLVTSCYAEMFGGCSSLNYIKALFTSVPCNDYTKYWVSGVSATGTFVKSSSATWTKTGSTGIPTGWTVETI